MKKSIQLPLPFLRETKKDVYLPKSRDSRFEPNHDESKKTIVFSQDETSLPKEESEYLDSSSDDDSSLYSRESTEWESDDDSSSEATNRQKDLDSEDDDDEELRIKTWSEEIQAFRARKRKERRHPVLAYFERAQRREEKAFKEKEGLKKLEAESLAQANNIKAQQRAQARAFRDQVASQDKARHDRTTALRQKEFADMNQRMNLYAQWDLDAARYRYNNKQYEADIAQQARLKSEAFESSRDPAATAIAKAKELAKYNEEDEKRTSQHIVRMMRHSGVIAAAAARVNPPSPSLDTNTYEEDTTITTLTLRLAVGFEPKGPIRARAKTPQLMLNRTTKKKIKHTHTASSAFTVELKRFSKLDHIRGQNIGPYGAHRLAKDLAKGSCPLLTILDLSRNHIGLRGLSSLAHIFRQGKTFPQDLIHLNLSANHLPASAVNIIVKALRTERFHLRHLDLRQNALRNEGAQKFASAFLAGNLSDLEVLLLQYNDIGAQGITAIYEALSAAAAPHLFPRLSRVSLRFNRPNPALLSKLIGSKCPSVLSL